MSEDTVWTAIKELQKRGLIERKKAGRNQNTYVMIVPPVTGNQGVTQSNQSPETRGLLSPEMEGLHPPEIRGLQSPETRGCIGIQSKGTNSRELKKVTKRQSSLSDDDFVSSLKANPAYAGINIEQEIGKMQAWLLTKPGRKLTRPFMVNWLNRAEKPVAVSTHKDIADDKIGGRTGTITIIE
jgi:hypothetical protein